MSFSDIKAAVVSFFDVEEHKAHALVTAALPLVSQFRAQLTADVTSLISEAKTEGAQVAGDAVADLKAELATIQADIAELKALLSNTTSA